MNYALFKIINGMANKNFILDKLMIFSAQYMQYLFGVILLILWFKKGSIEEVFRNRKAVIFSILTLGIAAILNLLTSLIYFEPRPFEGHIVNQLIKHAADASFPSDHATAAFALTFPILFVNKRYGWVMIVMASLLSFSRVYVGVHYPYDVVAGALISIIAFFIIEKYYKYPNLIAEHMMKLWGFYINMITKSLKMSDL